MGLSSFDIMYACSTHLVDLMGHFLPSNDEKQAEDAGDFAGSSLHIWDHVELSEIAMDFQQHNSKSLG